ncbi:MAG: (Fe-S)-binding protein [Gammaproteobacteria bacterium]|nr:(Fe-S)-binding protein [Gammaproteobacteria bacterium]
MSEAQPRTVGLFVTCLADLFRPSVAFSSIALLEQAGCAVEVPQQQTCCGQPGYNTGAFADTRPLAQQVIETFSDYDWVVAPSGSCAGMIKHHYPALFKDLPEWEIRAQELAARTWELTSFLVDVLDYQAGQPTTSPEKTYTYHDGCAGLREMGVKQQPRQLLKSMQGIELMELEQTEVCCGFGGTFCAKMPEISEKMVSDKLDCALATGADVLLGGDLGCLMNISGRARRLGQELEVRHVAEVLAQDLDGPGIGEGEA